MITYPVGISPTGSIPYPSSRLTYVDTRVPVTTAISSIGIGMTDRFLTSGCQHRWGMIGVIQLQIKFEDDSFVGCSTL